MNKPIKQTPLVRRLEEEYEMPIEQLLLRIFEKRKTIIGVAEELGIDRNSLYYLVGTRRLMEFRLRAMRIAERKGELADTALIQGE